jgi:hypothetical protein
MVSGAILAVAVISGTPAARADVGSFFVDVTNLYGKDASFQRGYVAGVYDAVQVVGPVAGRGTALYRVAACLDQQGDTLTESENYAADALRQAKSHSEAAADPILAACVR